MELKVAAELLQRGRLNRLRLRMIFSGRIVLNLHGVWLDLSDRAGGSLAAATNDDICIAEVECNTVKRWTLPDEIEQICVDIESAVNLFLILRRRILWRLCEDRVEPLLNGLSSCDTLVTVQCLKAEVNVDGNFQLSEILISDIGANLIEDLEVPSVRDADNHLVALLLN